MQAAQRARIGLQAGTFAHHLHGLADQTNGTE
jgi:hypothetical protein